MPSAPVVTRTSSRFTKVDPFSVYASRPDSTTTSFPPTAFLASVGEVVRTRIFAVSPGTRMGFWTSIDIPKSPRVTRTLPSPSKYLPPSSVTEALTV